MKRESGEIPTWAVVKLADYYQVSTDYLLGRTLSRDGAIIEMEELADAVDLARGSSREEHQMLSGIVSFVNTEVEEIMRPRIDITALDIKSTYEQVKSVIIDSGYSRIPVYDEDLDNIKGALYVKDLLPHITCGDEFGWQQLLRKIYFVPKHKKIDDLLREFQENKIHVAIVVDEYGATQGLVSLEDILEEVVGEISDESDEDESFYERLNDNTYIFDGKTHIVDFERADEMRARISSRACRGARDAGGPDARIAARPAEEGRHGRGPRHTSHGAEDGRPPCRQDKSGRRTRGER